MRTYRVVYRKKYNTLAHQQHIDVNARNMRDAKEIAKQYIDIKANTILYAERAIGMVNTVNKIVEEVKEEVKEDKWEVNKMKEYTGKKLVNTKTGYEYRIFKDNVGEGVIVNGMFTYLTLLGIKNGEDRYHVYAVVNDR